MKIAFLALDFKAPIYNSLILEFVKNGHDVVVITPTYKGYSKFVEEDGLKVLYFKSFPMLNIGIIRKGFANVVFPSMCLRVIKKFIKNDKFDLILMTTPPLVFFKPTKYLKRNENSVLYVILRDIHPEGAKFIGLDKIKPLYNYLRKIEINLYSMADYIGCMSPRNIDFIAERNVYLDEKKLRKLPNWGNTLEFIEPKGNIKKKYDLENKIIVLYGGNMGKPQNLGILLNLAESKKTLENVLFLLIGSGTEKSRLEKQAQKMNLKNVRFMDFITPEDYNDLMKVCDIGFISLNPKIPIPNIPSKTLGYFGAKLPILAAIDPITDYGDYMLDMSHSGLWSLATDFEGLSANFDKLYYNADLRKQMGENGYNYLLNNLTTDKAYNEIISAYNNYGN